jgi:uncharacterized protein with NRDE domain
MCLLALLYRVVEDAAVVVGANREEAYDRGGEPPQILEGPCPFVAGIDPVAKGTWLGVNERGVLIAVTNRPKSILPEVPRSRGLLARDLLGKSSAREAVEFASRELDQGSYAGCNVLCADQGSAVVIHGGDWLRVRPLPPGIHVLTSRDVDDPGDRRIGHALGWLGGRSYATADDCVASLRELCSQKGNDHPAMCIHGEKGGTVSSSLIALGSSFVYLHAQGSPDQTPYASYSHLLRTVLPSSSVRA